MRNLPRARLEDWLREHYFTARVDLSSSGVEAYAMPELRAVLDFPADELDHIVFRDGHSCGAPELRAAIAARFGDGDPAKVLVANGSCEAEFLFMSSFFAPGEEVVVIEPSYHTLGALAAGVGCRVVPWPLRAEDDFVPDIAQLRRLVSDKTRAIIVNFPHNPTGVSIDAATQRAIVDIARSVGAYLVWDAAFRELTYDVDPLIDACRLYERAVSFGTLSKAYGLPGLRVGWCIMPEAAIDACVKLRGYITYSLSPVVERIALHAVRGSAALLAPRHAQARRNLAMVAGWMQRHKDQVAWARPGGGVTAFPKLLGVPDVEQFCARLMKDHGVLVVPGTCFGMPGHIRIGFGGPSDKLELGLAQLSLMLREVARPARAIDSGR